MDNEKFKELFTVDPIPRTEKVKDSIVSNFNYEKQHRFNISNGQVTENGIVVEERNIRGYLQEVAFLFYDTLKASEIPDFLDYHYNNAKDKAGLLSFIKFDLWELWPLTKNEQTNDHRKSIVSEWLQAQKPPQQKKEPLSLEAIFQDKEQLDKLVELLVSNKFVELIKTGPQWTGQPVEFAAMAKICTPLIKKSTKGVERHEAWNNYFSYQGKNPIVSIQYFKSTKDNEIHFHLTKFTFIKDFFNLE